MLVFIGMEIFNYYQKVSTVHISFWITSSN